MLIIITQQQSCQNNIYQNVVLLVYGFKLYQGDLLSSKFTLINIGIKNFNHHML